MDCYNIPDEGEKIDLDDNNVSNYEEQLDEKAIYTIFAYKNCPDEDLEISSEDNRRRFGITTTKEKSIKTENNLLTSTMNINQKSINILPDKNVKGNETPERGTTTKDTPTIKRMENSRKIFDIQKVNKKPGRMPKNLKKKLKKKFAAPHNKNSEDNIIRKIKAKTQEIFMNYINYEYSKFMKTKGISKKLSYFKE